MDIESIEVPSKASPVLSYWVVAFLDLLGYESALARMDVFPFPEDPVAYGKVVAAFARDVKLRRRLFGLVNEFLSEKAPPVDLSHLSIDVQKAAEKWRKVEVLNVPGADHWVVGCSLAPSDTHSPMRAVLELVSAASAAMIIQLAQGADDPDDTLPLRGGIDIALGELVQPENFLYSPALTRAYKLERDRALYARSIIGERFVGFIKSAANDEEPGVEANYNRELAKAVMRFLFRDKDGLVALDFMGPGLHNGLDEEFATEIATNAWSFANAAHSRWRENGRFDIAAKYDWLLDYMRPRLSDWGVKA